MDTYATIANVIKEYVAPSLAGAPGEYDMDAIAYDVATYYPGDLLADGRHDANTAGFHITATEDEFWAAVQAHEVAYQ